jgi:ABC-2 type transport system ATP-binding protein
LERKEARQARIFGRMEFTIETRGLTRHFGKRRVVDDLRLEVPRGTVFGFLGQNGAGKTTTMRLILGLIAPSAGEVLLFGKPLERPLLARTGALVESPGFYPFLSGRKNLVLLAKATGRVPEPEKAADEALAAVELADRGTDLYKTYSRGMKQRLGIAWAILGKPELVLLDEPLNGLDPPAVLKIRALIADLAKQGTTVFLSSHLLHEIELGCDRVAIIDRGRLISQGSVAELLQPGRATLEVEVQDLEGAAAIARELPFVSAARVEASSQERREGRPQVLVVELENERAPDLNRALVEKGYAPASLVPRRRTLEELYHARVAESRHVPVPGGP